VLGFCREPDDWNDAEFAELLAWAKSDPRHHLAISNPKFELFLVMHYERGNGCTTPQKVDAALKKNWPRYAKRISATHFTREQVETAVENARIKRAGCQDPVPAPGMTDVYLLVGKLIGKVEQESVGAGSQQRPPSPTCTVSKAS
jgi:hypothetical protein